MTAIASFPDIKLINNVSRDASSMGYEIVDLAGFLDLVEHQAQEQRSALSTLNSSANSVTSANAEVFGRISDLMLSVNATSEEVENCAKHVRSMSSSTRDVANWVQELGTRAATVSDTVQAMKKNNSQIGTIALQVNTLAINAKIEAARAGDMGRGFAVVAEAINELSQQTRAAADQISTNIETLADWINALGSETEKFGKKASTVLEGADSSDAALSRMETSLTQTQSETQQIEAQSEAATKAMNAFAPNLTTVSDAVHRTSSGITEAHSRIEKLIDTSESLVQQSAAMGGTTQDAPFIDYVKAAAQKLSDSLSSALANGEISMGALFSRTYTPIEGSDPPQVIAPFTKVFDRVLPAIQEPALEFDSKVVFCAAVDQNGYLPTHNRKFSKPQGNDPVWNTANCRNRRIFDDRVGLKAGRNTRPFLLQVYRRDMGGGNFVMMKDLSAPIFVNDKHWGGLRFAYTF